MSGRLSGRVAFVTLGEVGGDSRSSSLAGALAAAGATVVVIGAEAEAAGRLASGVGAAAVFCPGDDAEADVAALVELAEDLERGRRHPAAPSAGRGPHHR